MKFRPADDNFERTLVIKDKQDYNELTVAVGDYSTPYRVIISLDGGFNNKGVIEVGLTEKQARSLVKKLSKELDR